MLGLILAQSLTGFLTLGKRVNLRSLIYKVGDNNPSTLWVFVRTKGDNVSINAQHTGLQ